MRAQHDVENERLILATMLHDGETRVRVVREYRAEEFAAAENVRLFLALARLVKERLVFSEDTLASLVAEDFGGVHYVRRLMKDYAANPNLEVHLERLRHDAVKRFVVDDEVPALVAHCMDPTTSIDVVKKAVERLAATVARGSPRPRYSGAALVDRFYAELAQRRDRAGAVDGFGFKILDSVFLRGFSPGGLSLIVARPATGKTTLLANLILHRVRSRRGVYVGGWEMLEADYIEMIVAAATSIPLARLSHVETLSPEEKDRIVAVVESLKDEDVLALEENPFVDLPPPKDRFADLNQRNLDLFEEIVSVHSATKSLFAIDVVGKMLSDRRPDKVAEFLVRLSRMAKRYAIHVLLLHHANREGAGGRPTLETIKNSGAFEEEADNVFGLDRPIQRATPAARRKMRDWLDVHFLKHRKGVAPLCIRYLFDGARSRLTDEHEIDLAMLEREDRDDPLEEDA